MLFSDKQLATFINENFEPCWQSLRPVPIITVDFGNGKKLTRTLHGNIATYVCLPDEQVVDVLPGIYGARTYQSRLETLLKVTSWAQHAPDEEAALQSYHRGESLFPLSNSKPVVEYQVLALGGEKFLHSIDADMLDNETVKRPVIHSILKGRAHTRADDITTQVYRRTLELDLDDPYLGLGDALSVDFPGE